MYSIPEKAKKAIDATVQEVALYTPKWSMPTDTMRARWLSVKQGIQPHLLGQQPAAVTEAFVGETKEQLDYRARVYNSRSFDLLGQAIDNVHKIAQSDDFIIAYNSDVAARLARVSIDKSAMDTEQKFRQKLLEILYKARVLDPNGYYGIAYKGQNISEEPTFSIEIYPSENVVLERDFGVVIALPAGVSGAVNAWRVYTDGAMFDVDNEGNVSALFATYRGIVCAKKLGGKPTIDEEYMGLFSGASTNNYAKNKPVGSTNIVKFNQSDFTFAVPRLDDLEVANSQYAIGVVPQACPTRIMVDIPCEACNATGSVVVKDGAGYPIEHTIVKNGVSITEVQTQTCSSCRGKKSVHLGAQDAIVVPRPSFLPSENTPPIASLKDGILAFVAPPVESAQLLIDVLAQSENACKEMLNLHRLEDFQQSGASKIVDRQAGFTRLHAIAEGIADIATNVLKMTVATNMGGALSKTTTGQNAAQAMLDSIKVSVPTNFDMRTMEQAMQSYFDNLPNKDIGSRYNEQINLLKKRNASLEERAVFDFAYDYTDGRNLLTKDELLSDLGAGIIDATDYHAATSIMPIIDRVKRALGRTNGVPTMLSMLTDFSALTAAVDAEVAKYAAKLQARKQPIIQEETDANITE
jgi:hypothetical protein